MPHSEIDPLPLLLRALAELGGAALVLDAKLRVVAHTEEAETLIGVPIEEGVLAAKLLCGTGQQRPVAEALSEGRAATAEVPRLGPDGSTRILHVRASPIREGQELMGFVLLLETSAWSTEGTDAPIAFHGIITRDSGMKKLLRDVQRVARRSATALVRGETGTGKELVARAIHLSSPRASGPFRAINCAALPPHLLESELFGHVRGAFTGAVRDNPGHIRQAEGGTLFLDEVAELSLPLQAKLLRVLQERTVVPVGGTEPVPVDVRLISATHRSLREAVDLGRFRADLMYRIRVVPLFIPPLRARTGDVELLSWFFIEGRNDPEIREISRLAPGALRLLQEYPWPGNVRELENAIEYAFAMGDGPVLTEAELPPEVRGEPQESEQTNIPALPPANTELSPEARRIVYALERSAGHKGRAAASLGMSRVTLWRKMKQHGIAPEDE